VLGVTCAIAEDATIKPRTSANTATPKLFTLPRNCI